MIKIKTLIASLLLAALLCAPSFGQQAGQLGAGQMWANTTANPSRGQPTGSSAYFDFVYGNTRGAILERGSAGWQKVNPSSTSGLPWVSNGAGADPNYQALVAGPAFGASSIFTTSNNGAVPAPGSSTGKFLRDDQTWQNAVGSGTVTSAQISAGTGISVATTSGSNPCTTTCNLTVTNSGVVTVKKQVFTASGTYTPSAGMLFAMIECVGSGGGGGGVAGQTAATGGAGGGGAGGYSRVLVSAATVGASQTVTVGSAGAGGTAGNNAGSAGGAVSVGTLCVANGGSGGAGSSGSGAVPNAGGAGGTAGTGDIATAGAAGLPGYNTGTTNATFSGSGAASFFGGGAPNNVAAGTGCTAGVAAGGFGAGGSGAVCNNSATNTAGGGGSKGGAFITEYNSQ